MAWMEQRSHRLKGPRMESAPVPGADFWECITAYRPNPWLTQFLATLPFLGGFFHSCPKFLWITLLTACSYLRQTRMGQGF